MGAVETAALAAAEIEVDEKRANVETAEVKAKSRVGEPLVYRLGGQHSYFRDQALAERGSMDARERLVRHGRQMDAAPRETRVLPGAEYRVNPNLETGHGGEFAPPLWLNEMFATAKRTGEVLLRLAPTFDLPQGVSSVNLPRITTGTVANPQVPGQPDDDVDIETAKVSSPAVIFSGLSDWSIQTLEQSPASAPLDWAVYTDLSESLVEETEAQLLTGTGTNEQFYGLLNVSGSNSVTYTSASPSGSGMWPYLGQALAQIGVKRKRPPEAIMMTSARLFWLSTSEDLSNRPLLLEDYVGSDFPLVGLSGIGVYVNDAIPTNLGASKEQDTIIACRPSGMILLHNEPRVQALEDVLSGTMQVRFKLHRTTAAVLGRYPSATSILSGTGMTTQTGYR